MKTVILFSYHIFNSKRKAGFHWIAKAFAAKGWNVLFVTTGISYLSFLGNDFRTAYNLISEKKRIIKINNNIESLIFFTPFHPRNLKNKLLNKIVTPIYKLYPFFSFPKELFVRISKANLIIFESCSALFYVNAVKNKAQKAKIIYRVSDDLRFLPVHPSILNQEIKVVNIFDQISVPCTYIYEKFKTNLTIKTEIKLLFHGIQKEIFLKKHINPFDKKKVNLIFVGNSYFDYNFLRIGSKLFPDFQFHIIGPIDDKIKKKNIKYYGELPFEKTVPFIIYANMGLHTLSYSQGSESFTDSLKVLQYSFCKLPIIAPNFLKTERSNTFYYEPGNFESIANVIKEALAFDKKSFDNSFINSWETVVESFIPNSTFNS